MKESIRLFVAAALPPALVDSLQEQLQHFSHPALRFMPRENLHLTLYFIGQVPREQLPLLQRQIGRVASRHQPFTLQLEQIEPGPKPKNPRLVWARFAPHPTFEALSRELAEALTGQPLKGQKPLPHITLARFRKDQKPQQPLPHVTPEEPLQLAVQEIALWQSALGSPHPTYSVLSSYPLG